SLCVGAFVVTVTRDAGACRRTVVGVSFALDEVTCTSVLTRCPPPPLEQAAPTTTKAVVARTTIGRRGPAVGTRRAYASDRRFVPDSRAPRPARWHGDGYEGTAQRVQHRPDDT